MNTPGFEPGSTPGSSALPDHLLITDSAGARAFLEPLDIPAILCRLMEKGERHGSPRRCVSHIHEHPTHFIAGVLRADGDGKNFTALCASRARVSLKEMREAVAGLGSG